MNFNHNLTRIHSLLLVCGLATAFPAAFAVETDTTTAATTSTTVGTSAVTESSLVAEFSEFLGGDERAGTIISGLRQGSSFDLVTETTITETVIDPVTGLPITDPVTGLPATTTTTTTTTTTIDPPTGTMGYGNVRIALRLAQTELNGLGITQATPEQLSAILVGGDINGTPTNGILTMRAEGMGWGQIAQAYGTSVGQIMGKGAGLTKPAVANTQTKTTGKPTSSYSTASAPSSQPKSNGYIPSGKPVGTGIVSGLGGTMGSSGNGKGQANKTANTQAGGNSGIGKSISVAGVSNAGGGGSASAPGQLKKN